MIPRATYRIQFHAGFRFDQAAALGPYLAALGISHLYASPIGTARAGSTHGYDQIDPAVINPELGGEDGFRAMAAALRDHGIGIIIDIVPNHMAVGGSDNPWWLDVLEHGPASARADWFDIDWAPADPALHGKLLAPFLGQPYAEALAEGALVLAADGSAVIAHGTHRFPIRPEDRAALADETDLAARYDGRTAEGAARLHALLERQHYRLAWWRTAADEINWRRFFDITELAGLRIEKPEVFDAVHALPLRLYAEALIDGLRIDHVDGLADPAGYLRRLRAEMDAARAEPGYLVVEKILAADEALPRSWNTDGTSGYDFMNEVSALLHDPAGEAPLTALWEAETGRPGAFAEEEHQARGEILDRTFPGQFAAAVAAFHRIARAAPETRDVTAGMIGRALRGLLLHFTAYRTYAGTAEDGRDRLVRAIDAARAEAAAGEAAMLDRVAGWIVDGGAGTRDAARRFEQLCAPLTAKAVEDTAFYRYGRLLSRNDVGFDPARFSQSPRQFLDRIAARAREYPNAMLATATHDHKRGEDVRARLAVLSEIPEEWAALVAQIDTGPVGEKIAPADRHMILQTIVGAWPLDAAALGDFAARVTEWSRKALREAKLRSSWTAHDEAYEAACAAYIADLLSDAAPRAALHAFVDRIAPAGALNSLVQTALRYTLPGVPDCYQGTDLWDFSLVDPDNRRPVDYVAREPVADWADAPALLQTWRDGRIKQALIAHLLRLRRDHPAIFAAPVEPMAVTGPRSGQAIAYRRRAADKELRIIAPLRIARMVVDGQPMVSRSWFADTATDVIGVSPAISPRPLYLAVTDAS
ncbi:malto-oligosyltrehalose synthase [Sphingomonas naphthae]|uniref:Malto-oligosyltrehalose synthase n=1 Tax=Sphingomonas naphthae TaxID=1813468 RepID=A0ABY7TM45_9SPHN|nr:malto-oligosyltrehalose synthase [Sphingomonas naphthae]WCT74302.1 malto-oligosyltrehalose synthase [Sphingomonas naphthae]